MDELEKDNKIPAIGPGNDASADATPPAAAKGPVSDVDTADAPDDDGFSFAEMLQTVPESVRDYLLSDDLTTARTTVYEKHGLSEEEIDIAMFTELQVFFGDLALEDFADELWSRLPWKEEDEQRAAMLSLDILGHVMLPAQAHLGDVVGQIIELGGDPSKYPQKTLEERQVSYAQGVEEIIEALGPLVPEDEASEKRLRHIIDSRLRDVRDLNETALMLTKSKKTGGMEIPEEQAQQIIEVLKAKTRMTRFVEEVIETVHAAGHEGDDGEHKDFTPDEIRAIYLGTAEEQKELAKRVEHIKEESAGNAEEYRERLYDAMYPPSLEQPDKWDVAATLILVAQAGTLPAALIDDDRFKEVLAKYLEGKEDGTRQAIEGAPAGREAMNLFLQIALRGFGGMSENDSARYGLRIGNILKKQGGAQYGDLVAFDLDKGEFAWTTPIEF